MTYAIKLPNGFAGSPFSTVAPSLSMAGTTKDRAEAEAVAAKLGGTVVGVQMQGWRAVEVAI